MEQRHANASPGFEQFDEELDELCAAQAVDWYLMSEIDAEDRIVDLTTGSSHMPSPALEKR
ncbi:hypothetical protein [Paraburkholderia aspalathi]|uniref:hypothetical protein n=1 Tax=Paraburkholderia aspalathi TaxID=1324617 RepID=UPI0038BD9D0B